MWNEHQPFSCYLAKQQRISICKYLGCSELDCLWCGWKPIWKMQNITNVQVRFHISMIHCVLRPNNRAPIHSEYELSVQNRNKRKKKRYTNRKNNCRRFIATVFAVTFSTKAHTDAYEQFVHRLRYAYGTCVSCFFLKQGKQQCKMTV